MVFKTFGELEDFDQYVKYLSGLDYETLRKVFILELKEILEDDSYLKDYKMEVFFDKLFNIQPFHEHVASSESLYSEQRVYADLISVPEFYNNSYVREFLDKKYNDSCKDKKNLLRAIFSFYDKAQEDTIEKFNYVFRSSASFASHLINFPSLIERLFPEEYLFLFRKEELSQIYRFLSPYQIEQFYKDFTYEQMFIISAMTKKVSSVIGHSNEFLRCVFNNFDRKYIKSFLSVLYDEYVGSKENEEAFLKSFLENDNPVLLSFINDALYYDIDFDLEKISSIDDYKREIERRKNSFHSNILNISNYRNGTFDRERDFVSINSSYELIKFKKSFLYNIFGINIKMAQKLLSEFGNHIDVLDKDIMEEDRDIYSVLLCLKNIVGLDINDPKFEEKITLLQNMYYEHLDVYGPDRTSDVFSVIMLEGLFCKMYINTYNKSLLGINDCSLIDVDDGVKVVDPGKKFNIMLTSFDGIGKFYRDDLNIKNRWNTAKFSNRQGISMSHISHDNLGVIGLQEPMIGFSYIPDYSLNAMGNTDIYSKSNDYDLRNNNDTLFTNIFGSNTRNFIPCSILSDLTRYGYNELLVDRFLINDEDNVLKLQPDYVVCYKFDGDYKNSELYKKSLKTAKDFEIPIVLVDVERIKKQEQEEISLLEGKLFSLENPKMIKDIITKYMNNYTGALVMTGEIVGYEEDFSVSGMRVFFNQLINHICDINDISVREEWVNVLEGVYRFEKEKFKEAKKVTSESCSVSRFILDDFNLEDRIKFLKLGLENRKVYDKKFLYTHSNGKIVDDAGNVTGERVSKDDLENYVIKTYYNMDRQLLSFVGKDHYKPEVKTVIDFCNILNVGTTFLDLPHTLGSVEGRLMKRYDNDDEDVFFLENLVVSYFFGFGENILNKIVSDDYMSDIEFYPDNNFIIKDEDREKLRMISVSRIEHVISSVENLSNKEFLSAFSPVIEKYSSFNGERFEDVACSLLDKKNNIRGAFYKFREKDENKSKK